MNRRHLNWAACGITLLVACVSADVSAAPVERFMARVTHVTDGDTIWVQADSAGAPRKLRLLGIDAPEICQAGGEASRAALQALLAHRRVEVDIRFSDSYARGLARVSLDGQDVAAAMVLAGQAWAERWHQRPGVYAAQEAAARAAGRGLFADPAPELPRDFRRRHGSCHVPDQQPVLPQR